MNIHKIAKLANVSVATVSRVINNPELVKESTLIKVKTVMEENNYKINPFARNLKKVRTKNIIMIIPNDVNPIIFDIAKGAEEILEKYGYIITLFNNRKSLKKQEGLIDMIHKNRNNFFMDGLILFGSASLQEGYEKSLDKLSNTPIVVIDTGAIDKHLDTVYIDEGISILLTLQYLQKKGHHNIGVIAGNEDYNVTKRRLKELFINSEKLGIKINEENIVYGVYDSIESGYNVVKSLLTLNPKPTVIFAFNDLLAIGVMKYLLENNYKIPEDLAVISCDNIPMANYYHPGITTINFPGEEIGKTAAQILLDRIDNKDIPIQKVLFSPTLKIRESC
ncbi:MAG: LacI family DNA-binding transcriptional regulator [Firmicutes bacterium]|nr:LacI family DNA-binding transcriptional regulator [Bacillota bacterium]